MKNEYSVSWKLYKSWAIENMFHGVHLYLFIFWSLFTLCTFLFALKESMIFLVFTIFGLYRTFFRNLMITRRLYTNLAKIHGKENWTRTISFGIHTITITDETLSIEYQYSDIASIKEDADKIRLTFYNKTVLRLYQTAFIDTDWSTCKALIESRKNSAQTTQEA